LNCSSLRCRRSSSAAAVAGGKEAVAPAVTGDAVLDALASEQVDDRVVDVAVRIRIAERRRGELLLDDRDRPVDLAPDALDVLASVAPGSFTVRFE